MSEEIRIVRRTCNKCKGKGCSDCDYFGYILINDNAEFFFLLITFSFALNSLVIIAFLVRVVSLLVCILNLLLLVPLNVYLDWQLDKEIKRRKEDR